MRMLFSYLRPYVWKMTGGMTIKFIGAIMDLLIPWCLAYIIDNVIPTRSIGLIFLWGGIMLFCSVAAWLTNVMANRIAGWVSKCTVENIRHDLFHKISGLPGHYYGVQFYVETTDDPTEMDNEDCRYYFDMYRSVAIRRYNSEVNKVCRILRKLAKEHGFDELYLRARFGNGAALYGQVENTNRSRLLQAVAPRR